MTLPNIPPVPNSADWKQWAISLRNYMMVERAQSSQATPAAPQMAHKKAGESAARDGVLIYNPVDAEMEVSVDGAFKRMLRNELEFLEFSTTETTAVTQGQMSWSDADGTVSLGLNDDVALQLGQEVLYQVKNSTGATIPNGSVVSAAGTDGASGHILVQKFIADGTIPPRYILGIATEDIANGEFGFVTHFGKLRGIDTSGFSSGSILYASATSAGALTDTPPVSPSFEMPIAFALNSKNNGTLIVRIQTGYLLHEIYDVGITSPVDGDFLKYIASAERWENSRLNLGDGDDITITSPAISHVLQYDGSGWVNVLADLNVLSDVTVTAPAISHVLQYNGSAWVNILSELNALSDVTISSPQAGQIISYDGSEWINTLGELDALSDVDITSPAANQVLQYDGSGWVNGSQEISALSGVQITSPSNGEILQYDGSDWVNAERGVAVVSVPSTPSSTGSTGEIAFSATHFYACVGTDLWKRIAWDAWTP